VDRWALAACLAAAAALGGSTVWQHQRAEDALRQAHRAQSSTEAIAAVLASPDARTRTAALGGGATGTVVVSRDRDRAVFLVSGMARPAAGKVYQLWFDDDGTMRSAGLMDPARTDQAVLLRGPVDGASGMGVTVEPASGSKKPTSAPVALLGFPA
uniref:anti-sigma factor n=1 Tax=Streptomyces shenzhenensis TaxID=943815 RepID=UPI0015F11443